MESKKCSKCGVVKGLEEFHKDNYTKDKLTTQCKVCRLESRALYRKKNITKERNRDKNRKKIIRESLPLNVIEIRQRYYKKNREKIIERQSVYEKKREEIDVNFKLKKILRSRIRHALKKQYTEKLNSSSELLGCSIVIARKHIESQFAEGMSWENNNTHGWHIDHIIPCASFDLTNPEEQKKCFHYTNLQPLWAKDNLSKGAKIL